MLSIDELKAVLNQCASGHSTKEFVLTSDQEIKVHLYMSKLTTPFAYLLEAS